MSVVGCEPEPDVLLLEVWSEGEIAELHVQVKRYLDDQRAITYPVEIVPIEAESDYVLGTGVHPLRVRIGLPESGPYAVHLAGFPPGLDPASFDPDTQVWRVYTSTICYTVAGPAYDRQVYLGAIDAELDTDYDTFPENLELYAEARDAAELPFNDTCNTSSFNALMDCNPSPEDTWPEGCPDRPDDADWNPFTRDQCADCYDVDCFGGDAPCEDRDGDGYTGADDCNDDNPNIHRDAPEICGNGIDENCVDDFDGCPDGDLPCDEDGDGSPEAVSETCGNDCDDTNRDINPRALEGCVRDGGDRVCYGCGDDFSGDGLDNNCNGRIDEGCFEQDVDNDGIPYLDTATMEVVDCNDCNSAIGPGFPTVCQNVVDEDCDGSDEACSPNDLDHDGYVDSAFGGSDCLDDDPRAYPGAPEHCGDGIAQGCAGDQECSLITDNDNDGFADGAEDCNDAVVGVNPWAEELCDPAGVDEDCDDQINEVVDSTAPFAEPGSGCGFNRDTETWYGITYANDIRHCGYCHHDCWPTDSQREGTECVGGSCSCFGRDACGGVVTNSCCPESCRDLSIGNLFTPEGEPSRIQNCGGCGQEDCGFNCVPGEECRPNPGNLNLGECVCPYTDPPTRCTPCAVWSQCCPDGCINIWEDEHNCGECENDCTLTLAGQPGPRGELCGLDDMGTPEDSSDDVPRCWCGSVGVQCGGEEWCTNVTEPAREPPRPTCGCADLRFDASNCDECGNPCSPNEECNDRVCQCDGVGDSVEDCRGDFNHYCCPTFGCRDLATDEQHCGACGVRCNVGEDCVDGTCVCGSCNDGNDCTTDSCNRINRCEYHTRDDDEDGHCHPGCSDGEPLTPRGDCDDSPGDCDDERSDVHPDSTERCATSYDDDCDADHDTNDLDARGCENFHYDFDDDTYGTDSFQCRCRAQGHYTAERAGDCNDENRAINPAATETCATGADDDCDGDSNDVGATACVNRYRDNDRDGYYPSGAPSECRCSGAGRFTSTSSGDCDDGNGAVHPAATETCATGHDDDCDGGANDVGATGCTTRYRDNDRDTYFPPGAPSECRCSAEGNFSAISGGDCNDGAAAINPGAREDCDTATTDDNCNDEINERDAANCDPFFFDRDGDTYGTTSSECWCSARGNFRATRAGDCNDGDAAIHPEVADPCDGVNNDCDGSTDEDASCGGLRCCGAGGCQQCCNNSHCPADHDTCVGGTCTCDGGWGSCGGTCNCHTGGDERCCGDGSTCVDLSEGECCTGAHCPLAHDSCNAGTNECECDDGWTLCGGSDCSCQTGGMERCCGDGTCVDLDSWECCNDSQCDADHDYCNEGAHRCRCDEGWSSCGDGVCDCNTGSGNVCCGGSCYEGVCCIDDNCSTAANPDCDTTGHNCFCRAAGAVCGGAQTCEATGCTG